jgi:serine/threonine-protein kinase ATR
LFDSLTGDTVHVDLNCLFDKVSPLSSLDLRSELMGQGKTFEIPEKVPFRLTHNMVEAMGVNGVEGAFCLFTSDDV